MSIWVFGYGSLLWNPGFEVADSVIGTLPDYARSFCMRSIHHRGTEETPGLVLALDEHPAAACDGLLSTRRMSSIAVIWSWKSKHKSLRVPWAGVGRTRNTSIIRRNIWHL